MRTTCFQILKNQLLQYLVTTVADACSKALEARIISCKDAQDYLEQTSNRCHLTTTNLLEVL